MPPLAYQKFLVYQDSLSFYREVIALLPTLPKGNADLIDQIKRASQSIPLNIAEGSGRFTRLDKRRFYLTAAGSAYECGSVLDLLHIQGCVPDADYERMHDLLRKIGGALTGLTKSFVSRS